MKVWNLISDRTNCNCPKSSSLSVSQRYRLSQVVILVMGFAFVEWAVGWFSHSVVLHADAGHMIVDALALGLALIASQLARNPAFHKFSVEGITALINGSSLVVIAIFIAIEAIQHWQGTPKEILSFPMMITAILGLGINLIN